MSVPIVVEIDTQEKNPLVFPRNVVWSPHPRTRQLVTVTTRRKRLSRGDYRLAAHPTACIIERKRDVNELCQNLMSNADRRRFADAWARFTTGCDIPVLLLDSAIDRQKLRYGPPDVTSEDVMSAFYRLVARCPRLVVVWAGSNNAVTKRTALGAELIRMMLVFAQHVEGRP